MLFVALFGYLGMQTGSVGKAPAAATKSADTKGSPSARDAKSIAVNCPALLPLASYLILEEDVCPQLESRGLHQKEPWRKRLETKGVRNIRLIIATIPDPDTVTLAHYANQSVESLRRAAEGCGYSPDRHWFPWFGDPEEESRKKFEPRSDNPGSLLFRRAAGENRQMTDLLLILLASETPTRGVHQSALTKALAIAHAFGDTDRLPPLEIVGPSYSGSAASLAQTLAEWDGRFQKVSIITGTATNPNLRNILQSEKRSFFAAIENDAEADARSYKFLHDHRGLSGPVAVVTEEGTAYAKGLQESGSGKETVYTFPMEISQVRNAYEKDPELQDTGAKNRERRTGLALRFREERPGYETIPNWAGEAGTYAKEFALRRLGDQIAEQRPSIIKIGASDVRDVLFVGGFLRRRFDDAQFVLLDADVLYGNTEKNLNMRGAISVSTYPLLLEAQTWEGASGLLQFTNQFAQGVFNALTAHIDPENMVQYGAMGENTHPPLWLTVYSRGTNWPLAMLPSKSAERADTSLMTAKRARLKPFLGPQHSGWVLLESVLFVCTVLWAWCLLPTKRWEPLWELASNDLALSIPASLAGGTLLILNALFLSIQWHYLEWAQAPGGPSIALGLLNVLAVFLLLATFTARLALLGKKRMVPLVLAVLFACTSIWILRLLPAMHDGEEPYFTAFFFVHRSFHLSSGVSPALPLTMFLGLLFLGAVAQMLSRWIAYWLNIKVTGREGDAENSVDHWTSQGCGQALIISAVWTLLSVFLFRMGGVATFEHPRYTRLFLILFILSVIFLSYAFLRLVCLFRVLREMMRCAAKRPFGEELKKVAEMKVWGVWRFHFWNIATGKSEASPGEALRYAQASQTIIQMAQCQVFFLLGGIVLGLFALQSYPFEPSRTFINYISFFFLLIGFGTFFIFGRIESAPFLMELYGTAGKSGVSFYWKTLSRFGIPLLAVLAAQFPDLGEMLVKVLTPFLESGLE